MQWRANIDAPGGRSKRRQEGSNRSATPHLGDQKRQITCSLQAQRLGATGVLRMQRERLRENEELGAVDCRAFRSAPLQIVSCTVRLETVMRRAGCIELNYRGRYHRCPRGSRCSCNSRLRLPTQGVSSAIGKEQLRM